MDKWEVELFDEKSAGDVALELHTARLEAEKLEQTAWTVHSEAARLKRLYEEAEKKSENVGYEVQMANERVRALEQYLNKRIGV